MPFRGTFSRSAGIQPCRWQLRSLPSEPVAKRLCRAAAKIRQVTGEELEVALADRQKPLIIDFYADWCGPCLLLSQELETVASDLGDKIEILKVDTEVEKDLASQLQIQGLPTMILVGLDSSKPALRTEGLLPANQIKSIMIEQFLAPQGESDTPETASQSG